MSLVKVVCGLLLVEAIHGSYTVIVKVLFVTDKVHPILFIFLRSLVALPCLLALAWYVDKPGMANDCLSWALGVTGNLMANSGGILLTQSTFKASLFQQLNPVVTTTLSAFQGRENVNIFTRTGALKWGWILFAVIGAALFNPIGDILFLVNVASYSSYLVYISDLLNEYPAILLTAWTYISGVAFNGICLLFAWMLSESPVFHFPPKGILAVLYGGIFSSTIVYILINWINQQTSPPFVTAFIPLQTVFVVILSAVFLGETVGAQEIIGGLIVCVGVFGLVYVRWSEGQGESLCSGDQERVHDTDETSPLLS
ncbi:DUF6-domain-containing protein [Rhizoclosmatium globosum]|uniref:DUF6-domain-containing protein n=1 Tax=Rhizoclosmatium globosum TaxID=329046 RepID=A0A1Y2C2F6_9FUNG|nr:DUF6-domain-containing protein [Rhizoclosmatium globosum]|eukprot:ORY41218.1 DUF6-domain-containing protein [Rhizoclosmatium globosum]